MRLVQPGIARIGVGALGHILLVLETGGKFDAGDTRPADARG